MKSLADIYEKYRAGGQWPDKGTVHSYIEVYDLLLAPYRTSAKNMIEVGILNGNSLRMWEEYFDISKVFGVDVNDNPLGTYDLKPIIAEGTHNIDLFDASNKAEVERHYAGIKFDVVIDDAAHVPQQQLDIYAAFKPHLSPDAIYVIEDVENIERDRLLFENIDPAKKVRIMDRRHLKGRFDDVLVIVGGL